MRPITDEGDVVRIPVWVADLASFRRWADTADFPEGGRIHFIRGEVWVDMSKEQLFTHVKVKDQFTRVLDPIAEADGLGLYFSDGVRLTNVFADVCVLPDGTFLSRRSLDTGRVRLVEGREGGYVEVAGIPDMVLEVVSRGSVRKDKVVLRDVYWEAGIPEYWLVDARKEPLRFDVFRHAHKGYVAARKKDGWVKSAVFGQWFRLTQLTGPLGYPQYRLEAR
jgi:hypothetical protein